MTERVLGIDGFRGGWIGVVLDDGDVRVSAGFTVADVVTWADGPTVVGIDIPIGLPDAAVRQADILARAALGPRRSSLFVTPVRTAVDQPTHADAVRVNRELAGIGISIQAFHLVAKILEVDRWIEAVTIPVVEVHPELSFARMAGAPLAAAKKTPEGIAARRDLLRAHGIRLSPEHLAVRRPVRIDDVLDAAAVAWSAARVADGTACCVPDPPETLSDGRLAAIWT